MSGLVRGRFFLPDEERASGAPGPLFREVHAVYQKRKRA